MFKPSKSSRPFNFQPYLKNRSGFRSCDRCRGITYQLTHSITQILLPCNCSKVYNHY
ncbi:hypothetical protein Hanom_Chr14g01295001 [Helianthus anomalus]